MRTVDIFEILGGFAGALGFISLVLERRLLRPFRSQQATSVESSIAMPGLHAISRWRFSRLLKHNVVRGAANGLFYLDEASYRLRRKRRLIILLPAVAVVLATVVILNALLD